ERVRAHDEWEAFSTRALVVSRRIRLNNEVVCMVTIESDLSTLRAQAFASLGVVVLVLFGTCLLAYFLARRFQRTISTPLLRLTDATRAVTRDGRDDVTVDGSGSDE